ncbi:MAG: hypothetical protein HGA54_10365, partial [Actinobacteria bacterium]|nr:hypothetical protein [Actinomycetota bacterium]
GEGIVLGVRLELEEEGRSTAAVLLLDGPSAPRIEEAQTRLKLVANAPSINQISAERIRDELVRIFLSPNRVRGWDLLDASGLMQAFLPELDAVSHRPYHTGFFFGPAEQSYEGAEYLQTHDWVATVLSCEPTEKGTARVDISQRNRFFEGDELEVLSPGFPVRRVQVRNLSTAFGQLCEVANRACEKYSFESSIPLLPHDLLRRKREDIAIKG